jgi:FkbM family methyltransferase
LLKTVRNSAMIAVPGLQTGVQQLASRRLLPRAVWSRLQPIGRLTLSLPGDRKFVYVATADDQLARSAVWTNFADWERLTTAFVAGVAEDVRNFVDVGAHTGIYSLIVAAVNPAAGISAFEPNQSVMPWLEENVRANGIAGIALSGLALSDVAGETKLVLPDDVTAAAIAATTVRTGPTVVVRTARGDDVISTRPVDLVKIDVEGHELAVLHGMERIITEDRPAFIIECLGESLDPVRLFLSGFGYRQCHYFGARELMTVDQDLRRDPACANFLFEP